MSSTVGAADASQLDVDLKVVLLGAMGAGKTALVDRFLHGRFLANTRETIGAAYAAKRLPALGGSVVLALWDTAGQERYKSLAPLFYMGAGAAVVCYDVTVTDSLARAKLWAGELARCEPSCRLYVCGCKLDLPQLRGVSAQDVRQFAYEIGAAATVETSSKTGENVAELFVTIAEDFVRGGSGGGSSRGAAVPSGVKPVRQKKQREHQTGRRRKCIC